MLKKNKWGMLISSLVILLPMAVGLLLWDKLPEQVPIHWNAAGEVDGWSNKTTAVFGMPGFLVAIHWLCVLVTGLDPKNKDKNAKAQSLVLWICPVISLLINGMIYATALGRKVNVEMLLPCLMGVLFLIIGNIMPKCSRNSTIGIKLPWTLHSDANWYATHRLAGKIWIAGSLCVIGTAFLPAPASVFVMLAVLAVMVLIPTIYSYRFYKTHEETQEQ